jgi:hypothetical protein
MRQQTRPLKEPAEKVVQDIRRATRKHSASDLLGVVHVAHGGVVHQCTTERVSRIRCNFPC